MLTDKEIDKLLSMFNEQNKFKELNNNYLYNLLYASYRDGIGEKYSKTSVMINVIYYVSFKQRKMMYSVVIHAKVGEG